MRRITSVATALVMLALLLVPQGASVAQGPEPSVGPPAAPVDGFRAALGTGFTYQGRLLDGGTPVDDSCNFRFSLYDNLFGGTLVAGPLDVADVSVGDGRFTVMLDFGTVFDGTAYWLEVAVQCSGDAGHTTMGPRQGLTAAPYALSLRPGAYVEGELSSGHGLFVFNTATTGFGAGVYGRTNAPGSGGLYPSTSAGLRGQATSTSGPAYGVLGASTSYEGGGVRGQVTATGGYGVYGYALASSGLTYGVYGQSESTNGYGVYGHASATSGNTYGVYGQVDSTNGYGVYGYSSRYGVCGVSPDGTGVAGLGGDGADLTVGVYGVSESTTGYGVYGLAYLDYGTTYGVYGRTNSPNGYGVYYSGGLGGTGLQSTLVETPDHGWRQLYNVGSSGPRFEDVGSARLRAGRAEVAIEPVFAQTVNLEAPYQVFLTAQSEEPVLLSVSNQTGTGFTVHGVTLDGRPASCSFHYRVVAKRLGFEHVRLAPAEDPEIAARSPELEVQP